MDKPENQIELNEHGQPMRASRAFNKYLVPISILLAGVIVAGAMAYSDDLGTSKKRLAQVIGGSGAAVKVGDVDGYVPEVGDDVVLGDPDAPVTIIEFSDYNCPFCARFFADSEQLIKEKYIKTGKARLIYKDYAFLGPVSILVAEAAECAKEEGKYWQYHDLVFSRVGDGHPSFTVDILKEFGDLIGLDSDDFYDCVDERRYKSEVEGDIEEARRAGVTGTPTVFINGRKFVGALPYSTFEAAIEEELALLGL